MTHLRPWPSMWTVKPMQTATETLSPPPPRSHHSPRRHRHTQTAAALNTGCALCQRWDHDAPATLTEHVDCQTNANSHRNTLTATAPQPPLAAPPPPHSNRGGAEHRLRPLPAVGS